MPYRRLPNTDKARLRALKKAIEQSDTLSFNDQIISMKVIHDAKSFLSLFEQKILQYQQTYETQVEANKRYQQITAQARLYVSHFIQVLNLAVIRGEIKKEKKLLYQLEEDTHTVPDLSTDKALLHWGKCIINGENDRIRTGGMPIYTPTIAKVQVHYEMFKEYRSTQQLYQSTTTRNWEELAKLRTRGDEVILEIWNQVEEKFKNKPPYTRLQKCQDFGLIYYYRKGEAELTPESDL